ncbi:hypothetical protein FT643_01365 [Ketobacter sp. MCCC 1A13808]|uniref:hypothetical protein n=1 Tax=Ketobacter sp. MCCC 1A13808 TaxID=2602738 RepID=UPI000F121AF4|nr:hypothetical protein [Ketobacter sp. MCCC 1A13808]MVF10777.1 hypothetical protein [Ketobacter sp. MCCC 1A13808]RLP56190.1 MAG: hypothetical protein D6160_01995 [Ketobacter sp.]
MYFLPFPKSLWLATSTISLALTCACHAAPSDSYSAESRAVPYQQEMDFRKAAREQREKEIRLGEKLLEQKRQTQNQSGSRNHTATETEPEPVPKSTTAPDNIRHQAKPYRGYRQTVRDAYAEQLPMVIGDNWILKHTYAGCSLHSSTKLMNDGVGLTSVSLVLTDYVWELRTQSDIEPRHPQNGILLPNQKLVRVEQVMENTNAQFPVHSNEITAALQSADSLEVHLSFWPSWPMTDIETARITVSGFSAAYDKWQQCNRHFGYR